MAVFFGISVPVAGITGQQVLEGMGQGSGAQFRFDEQVYGMANSDAPLAHGLWEESPWRPALVGPFGIQSEPIASLELPYQSVISYHKIFLIA